MLATQTLGPHAHAIRIEDQSVAKTLEILEAVAESGKTPRLVKMLSSLTEGERSALTAALTRLGTQWIRQPVNGAVTRLLLLRLQKGLSRIDGYRRHRPSRWRQKPIPVPDFQSL